MWGDDEIRLRERVEREGERIGTIAKLMTPPRYYLLDGAVYCILSHTQCQYSGTLDEFRARVERGQVFGFAWEGNSHGA